MKNTNYFGRICRFLGRITLFIGLVLNVGICTLSIANFLTPQNSKTTTTSYQDNQPSQSYHTYQSPQDISPAITQNKILAWILVGLIVTVTIIAVIYLAQKYNSGIRHIIANLSKILKIPIHMTELGLTLIIWSATLVILILNYSIISLFLAFIFIFNVLFFLLGWLSYGMPDYKV